MLHRCIFSVPPVGQSMDHSLTAQRAEEKDVRLRWTSENEDQHFEAAVFRWNVLLTERTGRLLLKTLSFLQDRLKFILLKTK